MIGQMICAFGADDVAAPRPMFRKLRFQMIADSSGRAGVWGCGGRNYF
jgi:hypothetical protein